jgi:plastocyanin
MYGQETIEGGKIEGIIQLAVKQNPVQVGGRYGRTSRSSVTSKASADSVLIWLEITTAKIQGNPNEPVILDQEDLSFNPSIVVVRQHGAVRIQNSDPVYHNVFSLSSVKRFDVGRRPKGEYLDVTFDKTGAVDVFCDIHSNMRATIYVIPENATTWIKVRNGESFALQNIESGSYQLNIYALGYQEQSLAVDVDAGELTNIGTITLNF